ncbi:MAG: hypothetical protein EA398_04150 [Deltaproteobacteria bacterium]|nr:MAG: hypothetical protein EA398_04150 [Deltaproteobacteria bacterium]
MREGIGRAVSCAEVLRSRAAGLRARSLEQRVEGLAAFGAYWSAPMADAERVDRVGRVARSCGLHPRMVAVTVAHLARQLSASGLRQWVRLELGRGLERPLESLATAEHAVERALVPPELVVQVLPGTVPALVLEGVVEALLIGAAVLLRPGFGAEDGVRALVEPLAVCAPELADAVEVLHWPSGEDAVTREVFARADAVVAWGSDASVEAVRRLCPGSGTRFRGHGSRVSFAVLGPAEEGVGSAVGRLARALALDASLLDQRGCMSPQTVFVHRGAAVALEDLADALATEGFPAWEQRLPRGVLAPETASAVMQLRGASEFLGCARTGASFTVILHETCEAHLAPPARLLHLVPWETSAELERALRPWRGRMSTCGLVSGPSCRAQLLPLLARLGVGRVCPWGRMQRPVLLRDHDGRPRLSELVRYLDVEGGPVSVALDPVVEDPARSDLPGGSGAR